MALSRKFLSALGIEADKIDEIIDAHAATVNALKEERDNYKADAERYKDAKKELDRVSNELETIKADSGKEDTYKVKYDALKEDFDNYKNGIEAEKTKTSKTKAYKELLKEVEFRFQYFVIGFHYGCSQYHQTCNKVRTAMVFWIFGVAE